jgi:hypothetical protein
LTETAISRPQGEAFLTLDQLSIFISYRRSDAAGHARALHEYLSGRFGDEQIFFDRDKIEGGDHFPERLRQGVEGCAVLLALIGPDWLDVKAADGRRRLDDPGDFVRQEVALALKRGKKVIPLLFDDTPVLPADRLPRVLKALAKRHAMPLRGNALEYQTKRRELVRLLASVPGVPKPLPEAGQDQRANELPIEIVFGQGQEFHNLAIIHHGSEHYKYDCWFLKIRNRTSDRVIRNLRVRLVKIGRADHFSKLDLPAVDWFEPEPVNAEQSIDLAPGETRKFQFVFQAVDTNLNFGVRFGRTFGYGLWPDNPTHVTVSAFSDAASVIGEFDIIPQADGLVTVKARSGVTLVP